ncbi:MAG: hypothetical protein K0S29_348 [Gammaproteobacteria bacterium]|jgi:hypothetical protein|nr:hypothetical protein [Gammaproteobacteria bacterium]
MSWNKLGLVYDAKLYEKGWAANSALTPTPILLENKEVIRVYFSARDREGVGRIRYADLLAEDPTKLIHVAETPVLDIGEQGMFDDNGVIMGDILVENNVFIMYYVGFQLVNKAKFLAYSGVAISEDAGLSFKRISKTPLLDRHDEGLYIRAIHRVLQDKGKYSFWYSVGNRWQYIDGKPFPSYYIKKLTSHDPLKLSGEGMTCISCKSKEYRIGRPRVYIHSQAYEMFYTKGSIDGEYMPGMAVSQDGDNWLRQDEGFTLQPSQEGWDSNTVCYPSFLSVGSKNYMFYNGNNMGLDGFGCAEQLNETNKIYR